MSGPLDGVITHRTESDRIMCMTLSKIPVSDYNSPGYSQIWILIEVPDPRTICGWINVHFDKILTTTSRVRVMVNQS